MNLKPIALSTALLLGTIGAAASSSKAPNAQSNGTEVVTSPITHELRGSDYATYVLPQVSVNMPDFKLHTKTDSLFFDAGVKYLNEMDAAERDEVSNNTISKLDYIIDSKDYINECIEENVKFLHNPTTTNFYNAVVKMVQNDYTVSVLLPIFEKASKEETCELEKIYADLIPLYGTDSEESPEENLIDIEKPNPVPLPVPSWAKEAVTKTTEKLIDTYDSIDKLPQDREAVSYLSDWANDTAGNFDNPEQVFYFLSGVFQDVTKETFTNVVNERESNNSGVKNTVADKSETTTRKIYTPNGIMIERTTKGVTKTYDMSGREVK